LSMIALRATAVGGAPLARHVLDKLSTAKKNASMRTMAQ
jgi:hypothetical protein